MEENKIRPHNIYACFNCEEGNMRRCKYRRRAKTMSNLDQWTNKCKLVNSKTE